MFGKRNLTTAQFMGLLNHKSSYEGGTPEYQLEVNLILSLQRWLRRDPERNLRIAVEGLTGASYIDPENRVTVRFSSNKVAKMLTLSTVRL